MDGHLNLLSRTVNTKGGVDASNHIPGNSLKRGYADWVEQSGVQSVNTATKRQNLNGDFSRNGVPLNLNTTGSGLPGNPFTLDNLNGMQDGVELSEPKITHQLLIAQKDYPSLFKGDVVFIPGNVGPETHERNPARHRGYPLLGSTGDLPILTPVNAMNIAALNSHLQEIQIKKLKDAKLPSNTDEFHRRVLGGPEVYTSMYKPWGAIYGAMDASGGDSEMHSMGWFSVKPPGPTVGTSQTKHVSVIKQGSHWIKDLWGGVMIQGTGLFLVLKPTKISTTEYYEKGIDPAAATNRFTRPYMKVQGTALVQRGIPDTSNETDVMLKARSNRIGTRETYVIYQWYPVATSGAKDLSYTDDLEYRRTLPPIKAFGKKTIIFEDMVTKSAAYIQLGTVKHITDPESMFDRKLVSQNDRLINDRRIIEVNILPYQLQII